MALVIGLELAVGAVVFTLTLGALPPKPAVDLRLVYGMWLFLILLSGLLGLITLRFGSRAFPLNASGQRRWRIICLLVVLMLALLAPFGASMEAFGTLRSAYVGNNVKHATMPGNIGAPGWVSGLQALAVEVGEAFSILGSSFVFVLALAGLPTIGIPAFILLLHHIRSAAWKRSPYVLFLRPFASVTNAAAVGPLTRALPRHARLVFLSAPMHQSSSWDPIVLGFAGLSLRRPIASLQVHLRSDSDDWRQDVRRLSREAAVVVIDLSQRTAAMLAEDEMLRALGSGVVVLRLTREGSEFSSGPDLTSPTLRHEVVYRESPFAGAFRRSFVFGTASVIIPLVIATLSRFLPGADSSERGVGGLGFDLPGQAWHMSDPGVLGFSLLAAAVFAWSFSPGRGYTRESAKRIRSALHELIMSHGSSEPRCPRSSTGVGSRPGSREVGWKQALFKFALAAAVLSLAFIPTAGLIALRTQQGPDSAEIPAIEPALQPPRRIAETDRWTESDVCCTVIDIISRKLGVNLGEVTGDSRIVEDLGADSLRCLEITMLLEEEFEIEIPDEDADGLQKVGEVAQYILTRLSEHKRLD